MKYYIRQIKPYIDPPSLHGFNCSPYPVDGYDWVSEDMEKKLREEIVVNDSWSKLIFKERFVEAPRATSWICICIKDCEHYPFINGKKSDKPIIVYNKNDIYRFEYKPDETYCWLYHLRGIGNGEERLCNWRLFDTNFKIIERL